MEARGLAWGFARAAIDARGPEFLRGRSIPGSARCRARGGCVARAAPPSDSPRPARVRLEVFSCPAPRAPRRAHATAPRDAARA
jgi:hypothetical protein